MKPARPLHALRRFVKISAPLFLLVTLTPTAFGQKERTIYSFGASGDGYGPHSSLTRDSHGNLYGVTYAGGAYNGGTAFELSPPVGGIGAWTETILHSFQGPPTDGWVPEAGVVFDKAGNLYGTTSGGGTSSLGVVYELSPPSVVGDPWIETVLYNFANKGSGNTGESGGGVAFVGGNLFAVTISGGAAKAGNVLELKPPSGSNGSWLVKEIYSFTGGSTGAEPLSGGGALIADAVGNLYGTALTGATSAIVFELSPPQSGSGPWSEAVLYAFQSSDSTTASLTFDQAGNLYGTAGSATGIGGTSMVFELSPPVSGQLWTETTLYTFDSNSAQNGWLPYAGLAFDKAGNLYGTTLYGGSSTQCGKNGCGTVFKLSPTIFPPWAETVLHSFSDSLRDGAGPVTNLSINPAGHIYGVTQSGGTYGGGTAFEVVP
jgi:uncharacterized repeat protein (TIGR03803 family)